MVRSIQISYDKDFAPLPTGDDKDSRKARDRRWEYHISILETGDVLITSRLHGSGSAQRIIMPSQLVECFLTQLQLAQEPTHG